MLLLSDGIGAINIPNRADQQCPAMNDITLLAPNNFVLNLSAHQQRQRLQ